MKKNCSNTMPILNDYLEAAYALGWTEPLVLDLIERAGGFEQVICDALEMQELIFTNSLASRPDLEENEPTTIDASSILENTLYMKEMRANDLNAFMGKHKDAIKTALKTHLATISDNIINEFFHLNYNLEYEDIKVFLNEDRDIVIDLEYVLAGVYYMILMIVCRVSGGMSALKLKHIDFSKVKEVECRDVNISINGNAKKGQNGIFNEDNYLQGILENNYIDIIYGSDWATNRAPIAVSFTAKKHSYHATPIKLSCDTINMLTVTGDAAVTADITNKKDEVRLFCEDHSNADIRIDAPSGFWLEVQNYARVVLSGTGNCLDMSTSDESMLFAARFVSDNIPVRCDDKSFVMANSENFYDTANINDMDATVINTQVRSNPSYEAWRQRLRDEGVDDGKPDYVFYSKETRAG